MEENYYDVCDLLVAGRHADSQVFLLHFVQRLGKTLESKRDLYIGEITAILVIILILTVKLYLVRQDNRTDCTF